MTEITLQEPALIEQVENAAAHEGVQAAEFVTEALRRHLAQYRQKRIAAETAAWYQLPAEQRRRFEGKYVAVLNGEIVGDDPDRITLLRKMRERFGRHPILFIPGGDSPMPTYQNVSVRSAEHRNAN